MDDIDLYVITFSKAFCAMGGALIATKAITRYVNWHARCRAFSAAIPPAVAGGILKALELGFGSDGQRRREKIRKNADFMKSLLMNKVDVLDTNTWIIPVVYGDEETTFELADYLQKNGINGSLMTFPAIPKNSARIRVFITSEHTLEQLRNGANIIIQAAERFGFAKQGVGANGK